MSDEFFEKLFGDSGPGDFGSGWMSGTAAVFFGLLGLGGALCLHFPALLSLPDARPIYPMAIIRGLIQGTIVLAIVLGAISGILRERKVLALTGASLGLLAAVIGGGSTPLPDEVHSTFGLGLDWFLIDLFVMTVVFLPSDPAAARDSGRRSLAVRHAPRLPPHSSRSSSSSTMWTRPPAFSPRP